MKKNHDRILVLIGISLCLSSNLFGGNTFPKVNWTDSISYYRMQFEKFSETDPPTIKYMETAFCLSFSCRMGNQYELGEKVTAKALVHGSVLADSCWYTSGLFSMLAFFYEQRGDTIMPIHFHQKSQILGLRNFFITEFPDSFEIYTQRMKNVQGMLNTAEVRFNKKHPQYLGLLNEWCLLVEKSGNVIESKYIGEQILKIARDSMLLDYENMCGGAYYTLLFAYASMEELERAEELLPSALDYFEKYPSYSKTVLYMRIAEGLISDERYSDALPYIKKAKEKMVEDDAELRAYIDEQLELCKKNS